MSARSAHLALAPERCDHCGRCVRACPKGLLRVGGGFIYVDTSECTGCMKCADACDRGAIARRTAPTRPVASGPSGAEAGKIVVGSRAEAKAVRRAAEAAQREYAAAQKSAARHAVVEAAASRSAETCAADGTAEWNLTDAAVAAGVLAASLVAKEIALGSHVVDVMPASGQVTARAAILGVFYAVQVTALSFLAHRHGSTLVTAFGLGRLSRSWRHRATSVLLTIMLLVGTRLAAFVWGWMAQSAGWNPPTSAELTAVFGSGGAGLALSVAIVVIAGPVVEEMLFRGVVMRSLVCRIGPWPAIAASSALFALSHGTAWALVPTFVLGIALGWLAWSRESLWPAIWLHVLYNGVAVGAAFYLAR